MSEPSAPATAPVPTLGVVATRGVFWTGGAQVIRQIVGIATSVTLARLLLPEDFGLLGIAMVFVGLSQLFADFGIGAALVQSKQVDPVSLSSAWWANLALGFLLAGVLIASAGPIARFYDNAMLTDLIRVLSLQLVLAAVMAVPSAILHRRMDFAAIARAQVFGSVVGALCALGMAFRGGGVWSLVVQPLVGLLVSLTLMCWSARWMARLEFRWSTISALVRFSAGVLGASVLNYATRKADDFLIGKFLGATPLGYYSLAYQIMLFPLSQVSGVLVKVLFPTLSRLQEDPERFKRAYLQAIAAIAMITFPMMLGLLAVAPTFVLVVFGEKWLPMVPVVQIFSVLGLTQSIGTTVGTVYLSKARTGTAFLVTAVATPIFLAAFALGLRWGIVGVAALYAAASMGLFLVTVKIAMHIAGIRMGEFAAALGRKLLTSALMCAAVWVIGLYLGPDCRASVLLGAQVASGAALYVVLVWFLDRDDVLRILQQFRAART